MILIVTSKRDTHADAVIRLLSSRQIEVFRLNTEDFSTRYKSSLRIGRDGNWTGHLTNEHGLCAHLHAVKVGWLRRPEPHPLTDHSSDADRFIAAEISAFLDCIYAIPTITWINDPFIAARSKIKWQQLLLAKELGCSIPSTIITNHSDSVGNFIEPDCDAYLTKAIYSGNVVINGLPQGIPSIRLTRSDLESNLHRISACPTKIQNYVPKAFELRVTAIGNNVFAVKIDSQKNPETAVDWRLKTSLAPHSPYQLPANVRSFCLAFLQRQGLRYGAFDFIVTPDGEHVFLENNPFGQYLWLELATGIPLTEAMCDYFESLT